LGGRPLLMKNDKKKKRNADPESELPFDITRGGKKGEK